MERVGSVKSPKKLWSNPFYPHLIICILLGLGVGCWGADDKERREGKMMIETDKILYEE